MKKFLTFATAALCGVTALLATACNATPAGTYSVYAPDGAPALALSKGISEESEYFDFNVVDAKTINTYVTGATPAADFCVLPVNAAAKALGSGTTYQMLGAVTNGNMYFMTTGTNEDITVENITTALTGKTVGVVQLPNVPGLTLRAMLADKGVEYTVVQSVEAKVDDKVNLIAYAPENVSPAGGCDYYLCPEPAATLKQTNTQGAIRICGDLQELYSENGYPQAVLVAKKSVIESDRAAVDMMLSYLRDSNRFLAEADPATVVALLDGVRTQGLQPSFTTQTLTAEVIARCSVSFTASKDCKSAVNSFLAKIMAIDSTAASAVSEGFFYMG